MSDRQVNSYIPTLIFFIWVERPGYTWIFLGSRLGRRDDPRPLNT